MGGGGLNWVKFSRDNHRVIIIKKKIGAVVFGSVTKVLFTALCALLSVFFTQQAVLGGDLTVQTTMVKQTKITGK